MASKIVVGEPHVYDPVDICIYCGSTSLSLSNEHVVPLGLGGQMILPKASCRKCAAITGEVERFCLRPMLGNFRAKLGLPTRRPGERPATVEILHRDAAGDVASSHVPIDDYPDIALGYRLPPPGILTGGRRDDPIEGDIIVQTNVFQLEKHRIAGKETILKLGGFNTLKFMRMLAKIGHAHAIARLGFKAFRPLLPDLILGRSAEARWLVGRDPNSESLPAANTIHDLWLEEVDVPNGHFLLAGVRLFSFAGLPKYHVVVGERL